MYVEKDCGSYAGNADVKPLLGTIVSTAGPLFMLHANADKYSLLRPTESAGNVEEFSLDDIFCFSWLANSGEIAMKDFINNEKNIIKESFESISGNEEMLSKIIEFFPYPIHVYSPDGTMILTNKACLKVMHLPSKDHIVGKFNVLKDPVIEQWGEGVREQIARSFQGEAVQFLDLQMPIQGIIDRFEKDELCFDSSFQNITCFPIHDDDNKLVYVVHVFVTSKLFSGKEEMVKAKEYMESHWLEDFDLDKAARSVNLSRHYFSRLFKRHITMTPLSYYQDIKINKLKEKLCDKNLSVSEAFSACGVDYNGNYARLFKTKVGMTPSQYRKTLK